MKVLEEGKWKNPWSAEAVCAEKSCGAKLLVEESDLKAVDYSSKNDFYAECAVCGGRILFDYADLPLRLSRALNASRERCSSSFD